MTVLVAALLCGVPAYAQDDDYARQVAQERRDAEFEAPQLAEVLGLKPGMTVADIGTGGGAMAVVLGHLVGSGRVFATDISQRSLKITREYAKKEGLTNIRVIEGGAAYPIKDDGAIETGSHRFCHVENGRDDCGVFKFVLVWRHQNDRWQVTRALSYDHK